MGSPSRGLARSIGKGVCLRCGALEDIASSGRPRHILSVARSGKQLRNQLLCFNGTVTPAPILRGPASHRIRVGKSPEDL
jgi:hypothetical protein